MKLNTIVVCKSISYTIEYKRVKTMRYNIPKRLRELRLQAHLSQEQTALAANITPAFLGQLERGEKNPTIVTIEKLCGVFRLSLPEFFSDHEYDSSGDAVIDQISTLLINRSIEEKQEIFKLLKASLQLRDLD